MKATLSVPLRSVRNGAKRIPMGLVFAGAVTFLHQDATAQKINLDKGGGLMSNNLELRLN
jgi:hypothetical protein